MDSSEVAARFDVSRRMARYWGESGKIEGAQKIGRDWIFPVEQVEAFALTWNPEGKRGWRKGKPRKDEQ